MSLKLNKNMVEIAMIFDQKPLDRRLTKLSEEQGELAEAILKNQTLETIEESIDVFLVALSIYMDLGGLVSEAEYIINETLEKQTYEYDDIFHNHVYLSVLIGRLSESIQKNLGVATSIYKGKVTQTEILHQISEVMRQSVRILSLRTSNTNMINEIIINKNAKWKKNAMKGFILSSSNQYIINNSDNFVTNFIEFARELSKDNKVIVQTIDYNQVESRINESDYLGDILIENNNSDLQEIVILYNIPVHLVDSLYKQSTNFKLICLT